jgi:hypothetical protein
VRFAALILAAALAACGGGGGAGPSSSGAIVPAPTVKRTTQAYACYFAGQSVTVNAYADHTNCIEPGAWNPLDQLAALAVNNGRKVVLMLPVGTCLLPLERVESETTAYLQRIDTAGALKNILAVRPGDEWTISDEAAKACITAIHAAMAKFPATIGKPLTIYYPCSSDARPGIDFIDWPGCDVYDWTWPRIFAVYKGYERPGESDRGVAMIAGGSNPWRQDPAPMVDFALYDNNVKLVQGFCWDACDIYPEGIGINGMAPAFRAAFGRLL